MQRSVVVIAAGVFVATAAAAACSSPARTEDAGVDAADDFPVGRATFRYTVTRVDDGGPSPEGDLSVDTDQRGYDGGWVSLSGPLEISFENGSDRYPEWAYASFGDPGPLASGQVATLDGGSWRVGRSGPLVLFAYGGAGSTAEITIRVGDGGLFDFDVSGDHVTDAGAHHHLRMSGVGRR